MYEYEVLTQKVFKHKVDTLWAFASSFSFVQTPVKNRIFVSGGTGDDETMRRTLEVVKKPDGTYGH